MGLGNRRRERKRDQDDRRSQNSLDLLLQHDASNCCTSTLRYRRGAESSRSPREPELQHPLLKRVNETQISALSAPR
jgi:hypothetical protein